MNRRLILLNVVLIVLAGLLGWLLRRHSIEAKAHERAVFEQSVRAKTVFSPQPPVPPKPVMATEYIDVAQKNLFAKDRNPNVIIDVVPPPPPPPPPPPMPALPSYYGQMRLGGDAKVLLSPSANIAQKSYRIGDKIGPFELVSFDYDKIAFKWNDKTIERPVSELTPKEAPPDINPAATFQAPAAQRSGVRVLGASADTPAKVDAQIGVDMGAGFHGCVTGDTSPSGTIVNGYKKVVAQGLMGQSCHWESVNK